MMGVMPGYMANALGKGGLSWQTQAQYTAATNTQDKWAIQGLNESLAEVLLPIADEEPQVDDIIRKMEPKLRKVADKFSKDERAGQRGTATQAQALVEEFADALMGSIAGTCYDKSWFNEVDFTPALTIVVLHGLSQAKIFNRTLAPNIVKHVQSGIYKWQEEERISRAIWEAVVAVGIPQSHQKKANGHLMKSYDDAHFKSPYGSSPSDSEELSVLQDFVKGWMLQFLGRAWDVLENGMGAHAKDAQVLFLTQLFQHLCDPGVNCLPYEIANTLGGLPAAPWEFIAEAAEQVVDEANEPAAGGGNKRRRM
jgi:hypothetical protein